MAFKIRNIKTGKVLNPNFDSEGQAWQWLAGGLKKFEEAQADDFHIYDESKAQELRQEGQELGAKASELAVNPVAQQEQKTLGEKAIGLPYPISMALAERGYSKPAIAGSIAGESALLGVGGPLMVKGAQLGTRLAGPVLGKALATGAVGGGMGALQGGLLGVAEGEGLTTGNVVGGGLLGMLPDALVAGARRIPSLTRKAVGAISGGLDGTSGLTGVGTEALEAWGGGIGPRAQQMKALEGKGFDLGQELLQTVKGGEYTLPMSETVKQALEGKTVDMSGVVRQFEDTMGKLSQKGATPAEKTAFQKLKTYYETLKEYPDISAIPADRVRQFRGELDDIIDFNAPDIDKKAVEKFVNPFFKKVRGTIKENLIETAGDPRYKEAMQEWSQAIQAQDEVKDLLKGNSDRAVENLVNNLEGKGKEYQRRIINNLDKVFGTDYAQRIKDYINTQRIGLSGGSAPFMTKRFTGEGKLIQAGGLMTGLLTAPALLASPKVSSGLLGLAQMAERCAMNPMLDPLLMRMSAGARTPILSSAMSED